MQAGQVQNQFNRTLASKPFAGDPFLPSAEVGRLGSNELLDLELVVLQQLDFYLVVFHPHRDVVRYVGDIGLEQAFLEDAWLMVCGLTSLAATCCLVWELQKLILPLTSTILLGCSSRAT